MGREFYHRNKNTQGIVYNNLLEWGSPSAFATEPIPGKWQILKNRYGSSGDVLLYAPGVR